MAKSATTVQHIFQCSLNVFKSSRNFGTVWLSQSAVNILSRTIVPIKSVTTSATLNAEQDKDGLNITEACVKQMKKVSSPGEFLRVSVAGGGCSGFTYKFELDKEKQEDDRIFSRDGVQVVSDEASLELIKGSSIDYEEELIKSAFRLKDNPQSSSSCSCGVSFSIDL